MMEGMVEIFIFKNLFDCCDLVNVSVSQFSNCLLILRQCIVCSYRENVHIMVLPVAETIEKQLMVILRDRQADLTDFLGPGPPVQ